jgi:mannose-6-phosphate isomerase
LDGTIPVNKSGDSFTVYMCVDGGYELEYEGTKFNYIKGDTVLIPADLKTFTINGKASVLEIYIS